jgi:hypothetical protein
MNNILSEADVPDFNRIHIVTSSNFMIIVTNTRNSEVFKLIFLGYFM